MKNIWNYFLLIIILIVNYSYGRYVDKWSTIDDRLVINEYLTESIKRINLKQGIEAKIEDATNIVCKTHYNNGLNIILTFELGQQAWECSLYKSFVDIFGLKYEKCDQIEKENLHEQIPQQSQEKNAISEEENDEAEIDKLNEGVEQKPTNKEDEEEDDEAGLDKLNQNAEEKPANNKQDNIDKNNENTNREEVNQDLNNKLNSDKEDRNEHTNNEKNLNDGEDNREVLKDNVKNEETNQNADNEQNRNTEKDMDGVKVNFDYDSYPQKEEEVDTDNKRKKVDYENQQQQEEGTNDEKVNIDYDSHPEQRDKPDKWKIFAEDENIGGKE